MKKLFASLVVIALTLLTTAQAQIPQMPSAPVDSAVRIGKLENGLTYYIRHNEKPKGQADFYIAQNVGSVLEEDSQRGLAHFLEHMCFNGTENFPGNSLVTWLETVGVKFGQNLNAYTSIDETVYNIANVPVERTGVQDSVLLVLHDWADGLLLETAEIDAERGVIHEEWRSRNNGDMRLYEKLLPIAYAGDRYGDRLPIGTMEVVDNFDPQVLRDYYETWYRPDNQGIIVVGDIDVDYIEGKIKELFSPIKMPENAKPREYFKVKDTPGIIYAIGADPEVREGTFQYYVKVDPILPEELKETVAAYNIDFIKTMVNMMYQNRLRELAQQPGVPYAKPQGGIGTFLFSKTKDAVQISARTISNDLLPAFEAMYRELLRVARGGFTESEYDRAKMEYLNLFENIYNERNSQDNDFWVQSYVRNFTDRETIGSIEDEYQIAQLLCQQMPLEVVNSLIPQIMAQDGNRVFMAMVPDKAEFHQPTEEEIAAIIAKVDAEDIPAFVDEMKSEPLIPNLPAPGKITGETYNKQWDATELTLSNGVKVLVKQTNFKDNEILFEAQAVGGTSALPESQAANVVMAPYVMNQKGLGDYTSKDLRKYSQGKTAKVSFGFDDYTRELSGSTTPKDLKYLMEFIYMTFGHNTLPADDYQIAVDQLTSLLANQISNPDYIFGKFAQESLYASDKKRQLSQEVVAAADRQAIIDMINQMTTNAADYYFVFVGNIDMDSFKPLAEQYLATLPADAATAVKTVEWNPAVEVKTGNNTFSDSMVMETPKTNALIYATAPVEYTAKNRQLADIAAQILSKRLRQTIREEWGAVYSIWAGGAMSRTGNNQAFIQSQFPMKPEMKDKVLTFIKGEFKAMENNVTPEEVADVKEYMIKTAGEALEDNNAWIGSIAATQINGVDIFNGKIELLKGITAQDVMDYMKQFNQGNYNVIIFDPKEK